MKKKAHYRRAIHIGGVFMHLKDVLALCPTNYPNLPLPIFNYTTELDCAIVSHISHKDYEEMHVAVFERDSSAAIVAVSQQIMVGELPPPSDNEFIKHQIFILISKNDVIFSTHNQSIRDTRINSIVQILIDNFCGLEDAPSFRFEAVLNEDTYKKMMDDGIGEIDFGVSVYSQALERAATGGLGGGSLIENALGAFGIEIEGDTKMYGKLVLRSGSKWETPSIQSAMQGVATRLLGDEESDDFRIVTKNGITITQDAIRLSEQFEADGNSQIVSARDVAKGLRAAYDHFLKLGVLGEIETIVEDPNQE